MTRVKCDIIFEDFREFEKILFNMLENYTCYDEPGKVRHLIKKIFESCSAERGDLETMCEQILKEIAEEELEDE